MSVDFPRAWQISASFPMDKHASLCSYRQTQGGLLCDCDVLMDHPEVKDSRVFYVKGGEIRNMKNEQL